MAVAKAGYQRCCAAPGFSRAFYDDFFARCRRSRGSPVLISSARTRLLRDAFGLLLIFPNQPRTEPGLLTRVAQRHSCHDLNVGPTLYRPFLHSLIATVGRYDAQFGPVIEQACRQTLAPGVAYMQSKD